MADEITITQSLSVQNGNVREQRGGSFRVTQIGDGGPSPGQVIVATTGTDISLAQLAQPGVCRMKNIDDGNYVEVGIKEPSTGFFYPFLELGPGEEYTFKFSRNLLEEYTGTGTGTSAATNTLHAKANAAAVKLVVEAFER